LAILDQKREAKNQHGGGKEEIAGGGRISPAGKKSWGDGREKKQVTQREIKASFFQRGTRASPRVKKFSGKPGSSAERGDECVDKTARFFPA